MTIVHRENFKERYEGHYDDYVAMMRARRGGPCGICGNTGSRRCLDYRACGRTNWGPFVGAGVPKVYEDQRRQVEGGGWEVAAPHVHPCDCAPGGGHILARLFQMGGTVS